MPACPFCAEPIEPDAAKCVHCGESLAAKVKQPPAPPMNVAKGLAIFVGVVLCCIGLPCVAAIAIPNLVYVGSRNEPPAIGALKTISTSQMIFREGDKDADGTLDYGTLAELSDTMLIDAVLGSGQKQGYVFRVQPSPLTPEFLWMATADPAAPGVTGDRYFATNQDGIIYYSTTAPFTITPDATFPTDALRLGY
jgi:hypothetical protein